jgi:PepSY-associated TM region
MNSFKGTDWTFWFPNGTALDMRAPRPRKPGTTTTSREKSVVAAVRPLVRPPAQTTLRRPARATPRTQTPARAVSIAAGRGEERHRLVLGILSAFLIATIILLALYGGHYYTLSQSARPFSSRHHLLKPSGIVGMNAGLLGTLMFCGIFLYPLRKRLPWLRKRGNSRHWLDYHVVLGAAAPIFIAFHSSFKFRGLAGIAFWVMVLVSVSGFVGLYLYGQIPRHVVTAEAALKASRAMQAQMMSAAAEHRLIVQSALHILFDLPTPEQVAKWPFPVAAVAMVGFDLARPFHVAGLRRAVTGRGQSFFAGYWRGTDAPLEQVIGLAREQASLCKRIVFLTRAQRIFQWWHVIHKPFSYGFAVLAVLHVVVAMVIGFV